HNNPDVIFPARRVGFGSREDERRSCFYSCGKYPIVLPARITKANGIIGFCSAAICPVKLGIPPAVHRSGYGLDHDQRNLKRSPMLWGKKRCWRDWTSLIQPLESR